MKNIIEKFNKIEDTRHPSYIDHKLNGILIIIMCAVLCGLDQLGDICEYAESKSKFFKKHFKIKEIPSKSTFCRILNMIDGEKVAEIIVEIMLESADELGEIIAVDGKAICSTSEKGKPHSALQILTAYLTESGVVLGQKSIHGKTNEIPVFQEMLDYLDIKGKTITADALHCQKETCIKITEKSGNYVFGLKENQKTFYDEVSLYFTNEIAYESFTTLEKGHGRIEKRTCYKFTDISWLSMYNEWCNLKSVFAVKREIENKHGNSEEVSFYISSLDETPEKFLYIVREHWKIESLHWILDVVLSEDECRVLSENGLKTLNIFRKLAAFYHKKFISSQTKKKSIKANMLKCLIDESFLIKIFNNFMK